MTREQLIGAIAALEQYGSDPVNRHVGLQKLRAQLAALPEPDTGTYKLFVWTDNCTFAAVAHAKTVAQARELIEGEDLGGYDASCPDRVAARKMIYGETPGIYRGGQAVLMFDTGTPEPEQPWAPRELGDAIPLSVDTPPPDPRDEALEAAKREFQIIADASNESFAIERANFGLAAIARARGGR